jgi:hypothetical protein
MTTGYARVIRRGRIIWPSILLRLYRVVAGRNCPVAASLRAAYVVIPGSRTSNRILAMVIARRVEAPSCGVVWCNLAREGIVPRGPDTFCRIYNAPRKLTVSPLSPRAHRRTHPAAVRPGNRPRCQRRRRPLQNVPPCSWSHASDAAGSSVPLVISGRAAGLDHAIDCGA